MTQPSGLVGRDALTPTAFKRMRGRIAATIGIGAVLGALAATVVPPWAFIWVYGPAFIASTLGFLLISEAEQHQAYQLPVIAQAAMSAVVIGAAVGLLDGQISIAGMLIYVVAALCTLVLAVGGIGWSALPDRSDNFFIELLIEACDWAYENGQYAVLGTYCTIGGMSVIGGIAQLVEGSFGTAAQLLAVGAVCLTVPVLFTKVIDRS